MQNITPAVEYFVVQCSMHSDVKTSETRFRREQHSTCMQCRIKRASDGPEISDIHTRSGSRDRKFRSHKSPVGGDFGDQVCVCAYRMDNL